MRIQLPFYFEAVQKFPLLAKNGSVVANPDVLIYQKPEALEAAYTKALDAIDKKDPYYTHWQDKLTTIYKMQRISLDKKDLK